MINEDNRVNANPGEPPKAGDAGAPRWSGYLDWVREECIEAVTSLPYDQQRTSKVPSGWTPLELLNHLLHMEQRWFVWGFLAEKPADPFGDWNVDDPDADPDARWRVPDGVTAEQIAERLRAQGERTREVLRTHDLHEAGRVGGRFTSEPPTLEWICFHVLAEYARHAGHLDITVELMTEGRDLPAR